MSVKEKDTKEQERRDAEKLPEREEPESGGQTQEGGNPPQPADPPFNPGGGATTQGPV